MAWSDKTKQRYNEIYQQAQANNPNVIRVREACDRIAAAGMTSLQARDITRRARELYPNDTEGYHQYVDSEIEIWKAQNPHRAAKAASK